MVAKPSQSSSFSLISCEQLEVAVANPRAAITIIDARTRAEYDDGHIPGAIWMGWEDWCAQPPRHAGQRLMRPGYWGVLDDEQARITQRLAQIGLDARQPIVVYAKGLDSKGRDGRIAWMLLYFGAAHVSLLDGGWHAWQGPRTSRAPTPRRGDFAVTFDERRRVRLAHLRSLHRNGELPALLDTRSAREYRGYFYRYMPRMGRIPGSELLPFEDVFDERGRYVTGEAYRALLPAPAANGDACIAYCEVGVRAATIALLHELYTGQVLPVYDGSLMEWSLEPDLPIAHERGRRQPP